MITGMIYGAPVTGRRAPTVGVPLCAGRGKHCTSQPSSPCRQVFFRCSSLESNSLAAGGFDGCC